MSVHLINYGNLWKFEKCMVDTEIFGNLSVSFDNFNNSSTAHMKLASNVCLQAFLQLLEVCWPFSHLIDYFF